VHTGLTLLKKPYRLADVEQQISAHCFEQGDKSLRERVRAATIQSLPKGPHNFGTALSRAPVFEGVIEGKAALPTRGLLENVIYLR
jgi:hypothetical protein